MVQKASKAIVEERDYAVAARVLRMDASGEELLKSERLGIAYRIRWEAELRCGRTVSIVEEAGDYSAVIELGDASEQDFEEVGGALLEASSW
jgi:hypothetical protein